jgi:hypothetical protein
MTISIELRLHKQKARRRSRDPGFRWQQGSNYMSGPPLEPIVSTDTLDSVAPAQDVTMPIADTERPTPIAANVIRDKVG